MRNVWFGATITVLLYLVYLSSCPEELLQVIELSVDVPADGDGGGHRLHIGLLQQEVAHHITEALQGTTTTKEKRDEQVGWSLLSSISVLVRRPPRFSP